MAATAEHPEFILSQRTYPRASLAETDGDIATQAPRQPPASGLPQRLPAAFSVLRRRWPLLVVAVFIAAATAYFVSSSQPNTYSATAQLLFRDPRFDQTLFGSGLISASSDPAREAATNVRLVSLETVASRTADELNADRDDIRNAVNVAPAGPSDVVSVTAKDRNAERAALIANTFAQQYVEFRRNADRSTINEAERLLRAQIAELNPSEDRAQIRELSRRAEELRVLASLQTGNAEVVQRADVPNHPSAPKPRQAALLAGLFGGLLGLGIMALAERLDRRLRDPDEIADLYERPILATVEQSRRLAGGAVEDVFSGSEIEAFGMLWANLRYFNADRPLRSLIMASAAVGDGKSTVAWNLSAVAASAGARVILIEADLRHPRLPRQFGKTTAPGLGAVLAGHAELPDVIERLGPDDANSGQASPRTPALDVLFAGPPPPNPADLLESRSMMTLLESVQREYDLVVIDAPPSTVVRDSIPLMRLVSGVIVVNRVNHTMVDAAIRLRDQLVQLGVTPLGLVVNGTRTETTYGYGSPYTRPRDHEAAFGPTGSTDSPFDRREPKLIDTSRQP